MPPDIDIRVIDVDRATGSGVVIVTNRSRKRVLVLTNQLVMSAEPATRRLPRPNYELGGDLIAWSHDVRVAPDASIEYMKVQGIDQTHHNFPAIYACWDNRRWTCDQYWLIPARHSWDELMQEHDGDGAVR